MGKKNIFIFSIALLIVLLDQLTKFLIKQNFQLNESVPIINNVFHMTYITNTGSAFGLFRGFNVFFVMFSVIVLFTIFYYIKTHENQRFSGPRKSQRFSREIKNNEKPLQFAVGLLLGGTIGNLIDRLFHGFVIDFLDFRVWPVFNIADSAVTISVILLIILSLKK